MVIIAIILESLWGIVTIWLIGPLGIWCALQPYICHIVSIEWHLINWMMSSHETHTISVKWITTIQIRFKFQYIWTIFCTTSFLLHILWHPFMNVVAIFQTTAKTAYYSSKSPTVGCCDWHVLCTTQGMGHVIRNFSHNTRYGDNTLTTTTCFFHNTHIYYIYIYMLCHSSFGQTLFNYKTVNVHPIIYHRRNNWLQVIYIVSRRTLRITHNTPSTTHPICIIIWSVNQIQTQSLILFFRFSCVFFFFFLLFAKMSTLLPTTWQ